MLVDCLEHLHIDDVSLLVLRHAFLFNLLGELLLLLAAEFLLKAVVVEVDSKFRAHVQLSVERALVRSQMDSMQ